MELQGATRLRKEYTALMQDMRKLQEKEAQREALEAALKEYRYNITTLPIIIGQSG